MFGRENTLKAQDRLISCERCDRFVITPFRWLLDELAYESGSAEEASSEAVRCPVCSEVVVESTLVSFRKHPLASLPAADYFDPPLENATVMLVDEDLRAEAQKLIAACEQCADCTEISFECVLDQITGCDPRYTEYMLCRPARCPRCCRDVNERTLVLPRQ